MSNPLWVGVDPHRKTNTVCLMNQDGHEVGKRFTVQNNRPGTAAFVREVAQRVVEGDFDAIHIANEATGWYWWHFFQTLDQDPLLNQWPVSLYPFNPRLTANYKKAMGDLDHSDPIDALYIADRLRTKRKLPAPFHYDERYLPVRMLTRYRFHLVHQLAREKSYCLAMLYLKFSEYSRKDKKPFSELFGATSRAVMQEFASIDEIAALPFDELVEYIDDQGRRRFPDPSNNARKLQRVAHDSYRLPEAMQQPINIILSLSLQHIRTLEILQKRTDTAIADAMLLIPQTLDTISGYGPVYAGGTTTEIGGVERFDYSHAKVAKYAGLAWRKHKSADFEAEETKLTRSGNRYLRYYLCEAANMVRLNDPEYKAYYHKKFHEVRKHQHKRAIVLTARKLVRLVVRLLTTNQPYQPRRL
jgi:transposase